jgi:dihydroorotase
MTGVPLQTMEIMKKVLEDSAEANLPVIQHCEVMSITNGGIMNVGKISRQLG